MKFNTKLMVAAVAATLSMGVFADSDHSTASAHVGNVSGGSVTIQSGAITANGGAGGQGGQGGQGGVAFGGNATGGSVNHSGNSSVGNGIGNFSPSATIEKGAVQNTNKQMQGQIQGQSQSISNSGNATIQRGAVQNTNVNVPVQANKNNSTSTGNQTSINYDAPRPAASAPAISLTSVGTDNCLGSVSGSLGTGFFSIGGGSTTESVECNRRAYSRALRDLGLKDAAIALLCKNEEVASVTPACASPAKTAATPAAQAEAQMTSTTTTTSTGSVVPASFTSGKSRNYDAIVCSRTGERCE